MTLLESPKASKYFRAAILDWLNEVGSKTISATDAVDLVPKFDRILADQHEDLMKISELSKKSTPQGNPELVKYLKSLTEEQLLTALRQYCRWVEAQPADGREWAEVTSGQIMLFYTDPLKRSDLSDDEYKRIKKRGDADELEAGQLPGRLTNEAYDKLGTVQQ